MFWLASILLFVDAADLPKIQDYTVNTREGRCEFNEFDCTPDSIIPSCVPFDVVRDCIPDCMNGEDEKCGSEQTLCDVNVKRSNSMCGKCVNNSDLNRFCVDRKWKNLCYEDNVRQCATNSNCVHESWLNDGEDDCGDESKEFPCDCAELMRKNPKANSSIAQKAYDPRCYEAGQCSFPILCNFELFGGGWTVIMHRQWPPQIHFNKTWNDYKTGFGTMRAGHEFWLGNDRLHSLTFGRKCTHELIIQMKTSRQGASILARYESIVVADESEGYKLTLGPLLTENPIFTPIDALLASRDRSFVTWDRQQHYCQQNHGGWWLPPDSCGQSTLTSELQAHKGHSGIMWGTQRLREVTMLIRPRLYLPPLASPNLR